MNQNIKTILIILVIILGGFLLLRQGLISMEDNLVLKENIKSEIEGRLIESDEKKKNSETFEEIDDLDKIKEGLSEKDIAEYGNLTAFTIEEEDGRTYVVLFNNNNRFLLESEPSFGFGNNTLEEAKYFNPKFLYKGKYLTYEIAKYDFHGLKIYDIEENKVVKELDLPIFYGATNDNKYFYYCASSAMHGVRSVAVYEMPNFVKKRDLLDVGDEIDLISCNYNEKENSLIYITSPYNNSKQEKSQIYFFDYDIIRSNN